VSHERAFVSAGVIRADRRELVGAWNSQIPRQLDAISRNAILNASTFPAPVFQPERQNTAGESDHPEEILWAALSDAPDGGWEIGDLMSVTGMTRTTLYRYLRELVGKGRAYQVSRGRWRARTPRG
jgi:hypothetical protein